MFNNGFNNKNDRRKHTRHNSEIHCTLATDANTYITALITDISYEGFRIQCSREQANMIFINENIQSYLTRLCFSLEDEQRKRIPIESTCRVANLRYSGKKNCQIGMELHDIECGIDELSKFLLQLTEQTQELSPA